MPVDGFISSLQDKMPVKKAKRDAMLNDLLNLLINLYCPERGTTFDYIFKTKN